MTRPQPPLQQFEKNTTSQFGEDGVIEHLLQKIPGSDRWCVEFGAWDGKQYSNTYQLLTQNSFSGVLIEGDTKKFCQLQATFAGNARVTPINRLVHFEGPNSLDNILAETKIPKEFDVLSIDIDGNDYHVWDSLRQYRPKIVVIEYLPTVPIGVDYIQPRDFAVQHGSSLHSLCELAARKGYRLVHATVCNGIFVDQQYFTGFKIADDSETALRGDQAAVTHVFQAFDGTMIVRGNQEMPWHGLPLTDSQLQVLPKYLRTFPPSFSLAQRAAWRVFRRLRGWRPKK